MSKTVNNSPGNNNVDIILDGPTGVGKSSLLRFLVDEVLVDPQGMKYGNCLANVNGTKFKTWIYEAKTILTQLPEPLDYDKATSRPVIIEIFEADASSLNEFLKSRMAYILSLRQQPPWIPILLVGTKNDPRQNDTPQSIVFPIAIGQCLAHLIGAVKYVECSAKTGQGIHDILEEAIRAAYTKSHLYGIISDDLGRLFTDKIDDRWKSILLTAVDLNKTLSLPTVTIYNLMKCLDKKLFDVASKLKVFSLEDICTCRYLEVETVVYLLEGLFSVQDIAIIYGKASCSWWCVDELKHQTYDDIQSLTRDDLVCSTGPISLRFVKQDCSAIEEFLLSCAPITVQRLVIISCTGTMSFKFLSALQGLEYLIIINTIVELATLTFPANIVRSLTHLTLKQCDTNTAEVPPVIGRLVNLQFLDVNCNRFVKLPVDLGGLDKLCTLHLDKDKMIFPPEPVINMSAQDIIQYIRENHEIPEEGFVKSTFVKSLKRKLRKN